MSSIEIGLLVIVILMSIALLALILLHKGKGGGLSDMFGGGMSTSLGGSNVVEHNLDRMTIAAGIVWFACIVGLNLLLSSN